MAVAHFVGWGYDLTHFLGFRLRLHPRLYAFVRFADSQISKLQPSLCDAADRLGRRPLMTGLPSTVPTERQRPNSDKLFLWPTSPFS